MIRANWETKRAKVHNWFTMGSLKGRLEFTEAYLMTCDH